MNEENLQYLQNNLKYLGFGESLYPNLNQAIKNQLPEFQLNLIIDMPAPNARDLPEKADTMNYELNFSKGKDSDMYFFNNYKAVLHADRLTSQPEQLFYINKGKGVTAKESFNLLSGRSVNKDVVLKSGEKANLWMQLDFSERKDNNNVVKTFGENYGFNLADTVDKFKISDIEKLGFKDQLLKSLERGNLHEVSFSKDGKEMAGFVTANPQFKTLDFFDKELKPVYSKALDLSETVSSAKEVVAEENMPAEKKGRGR